MSRFELAEAAVLIPVADRKEATLYMARAHDAAPEVTQPFWLAMTALAISAWTGKPMDGLVGDGALVVKELRALPKDRRPEIAMAMLDVSDERLRPLFEVLAGLLGRWGWT